MILLASQRLVSDLHICPRSWHSKENLIHCGRSPHYALNVPDAPDGKPC